MLAKRFFYVSAALLMLALTYHLGARTATAQAPANPVVTSQIDGSNGVLALTAGGDVYQSHDYGTSWSYRGNVFGAPTATTGSTWGKVKAGYRK